MLRFKIWAAINAIRARGDDPYVIANGGRFHAVSGTVEVQADDLAQALQALAAKLRDTSTNDGRGGGPRNDTV